MTRSPDLSHDLDQILPDTQVQADLEGYINSDSSSVTIELNTTTRVTLERGMPLEPVSKCFCKERDDVGFGSGYRVQVAIGGIARVTHGIAIARVCFATLYYNQQTKLITVDFHADMR